MSRRISIALVGLIAATILLVGIGTFGLARIANRNQSLKELEQQVQRANNLMPAIGVLLPQVGTTTTSVPDSAVPDSAVPDSAVPDRAIPETAGPSSTIPWTEMPAGPERQKARLEQRAQRQATRSTTVPAFPSTSRTATPQQMAAATARTQLLEALNVTGVGQIFVSADGTPQGQLPEGMVMSDLDVGRLQRGEVLSGVRGNTLWAAAAREETTRRGVDTLAVTAITKTQERIFGPTAKWFVWSSAASLLIAAIVALLLGRRLAQPVHAAVGATQSLARGERGVRLADPGGRPGDELSILAQSINSMADQLERAKDQERQFLLSVSHDLRTPMTSIRGYAEAIRDGAIDDPRRAADVILGESQRLERLIGDLLDLARIDSNRFELDLVRVNVADLVVATIAGFRPELEEADLSLDVRVDPATDGPDGEASLDPDRFAQVIANLITNAVSFAATTVTADISRDDTSIIVAIIDDGPGIRTDALGRIFERLYQADNQRTRRSGGSGLGLAIVSELVTAMSATVTARSDVGHGATFEIRIPITAAGATVPRR